MVHGVPSIGKQARHRGDDVLRAVAHTLVVADLGDDDSPIRTRVLGPDRSGNMLEVIVLRRRTRDGDPRDADAKPLPRAAPPRTGDMTMIDKKHNTVVGTSRGKPVTEADIERMAAEAEAGDTSKLRQRGGRPPVRLSGSASRTEFGRTTRSDARIRR
jgi:hypothetical protein